jgi:hypothetical protein
VTSPRMGTGWGIIDRIITTSMKEGLQTTPTLSSRYMLPQPA